MKQAPVLPSQHVYMMVPIKNHCDSLQIGGPGYPWYGDMPKTQVASEVIISMSTFFFIQI